MAIETNADNVYRFTESEAARLNESFAGGFEKVINVARDMLHLTTRLMDVREVIVLEDGNFEILISEPSRYPKSSQ